MAFAALVWHVGWSAFLLSVVGAGVIVGAYLAGRRHCRPKVATLEVLLAARADEVQAAREEGAVAGRARDDALAALGHAEASAASELAIFKFIFDAVPVGISWVTWDPDNVRVLRVNPAHVRITGVPAEESNQLAAFTKATHPEDVRRQQEWLKRYASGEIDHYSFEKRFVHPDGCIVWVMLNSRMFTDPVSGKKQAVTTLVDITALKQAEDEREKLHWQLQQQSRLAGMAEIAIGVLHNVGNVLNSVNVSVALLTEQVQRTKSASVGKLASLLSRHEGNLGEFMTQDPQGRKIPDYLGILGGTLADEQKALLLELERLRKNVDHINEIVAMHQTYAKGSGIVDAASVPEMIEEALRINADSLERHDIQVLCDLDVRPVIPTDKHKVMQILINLVRNAERACTESGRPDKRIVIRTAVDGPYVNIAMIDNGIGIESENLTRIFAHGFVAGKDGHGAGLHSGALAAKEIGGMLTAQSEGPGRGATFILALPLLPKAKISNSASAAGQD